MCVKGGIQMIEGFVILVMVAILFGGYWFLFHKSLDDLIAECRVQPFGRHITVDGHDIFINATHGFTSWYGWVRLNGEDVYNNGYWLSYVDRDIRKFIIKAIKEYRKEVLEVKRTILNEKRDKINSMMNKGEKHEII